MFSTYTLQPKTETVQNELRFEGQGRGWLPYFKTIFPICCSLSLLLATCQHTSNVERFPIQRSPAKHVGKGEGTARQARRRLEAALLQEIQHICRASGASEQAAGGLALRCETLRSETQQLVRLPRAHGAKPTGLPPT